MNAVLRQISSPGVTNQPLRSYTLIRDREIEIGRDPKCHIALDSSLYTGVSRRHFALHSRENKWEICDLNSANGTYLNGQRLHQRKILHPGDSIRLGKNGPEFVFEIQATPPPSSLDTVTLTQLFPIISTGRELTQKAYLIPVAITIFFVVLLFASIGEPVVFNLFLAGYLSCAAYYFVYQLCGKSKPWWALLGTGLATAGIIASPLLIVFIFTFRTLLPGSIPLDGETVSFPSLLVRMFFGAGLMEELLKALPVAIALGLGKIARSPLKERLGVTEPLDGILLGAASAVGFTLMETLGQYVPTIITSTALQSGEGVGQLVGLQLLIPRILGSVSGHIAYSGYLGYFIGLSVLKPRRRWKILGVGYLTAAILHALWNTIGYYLPILLTVVGVTSYACLAAAILKARLLSPTREQNFATRLYK
ncbi:PrsW family glutamic-type intramembrane protease [Lusitaniella coriacea]|uniref:PrsW family glutamic-type intramembrane protease n=1 Tax=Lusitaniella coriacea TaxID=1983105 RepID=UPI003CF7258E